MSLSLFRFVAAVGGKLIVVCTLGTCTLIMNILLGGFIVAQNDIEPFMIWGYYISPVMYGQNALVINEFLDKRWSAVVWVLGSFEIGVVAEKLGKSRKYQAILCIGAVGNYADSISCYNEVLRIDPLAADGLVNRGNTYKEIGRVNEAIQDYLRAIAIRPTMAEAHANLASAYKDSGHVDAAIKSYKQALVLRPDFPEATCNLLHTLQFLCMIGTK